jgi:uncharacterized protein YajQ (UPF0234 family)
MPSFDIVSKVDMHEISNAVDQTAREVSTRFDFKGSNARLEISEDKIILTAGSDFQLQQMKDILISKAAKRQVDLLSLDFQEPDLAHREAKQEVLIRQGISTEDARKLVKLIKDKKLKVQAAIQGDQVRVSGKKRDDLQEVIAMLKAEKLDISLQYENFRD